MPKAEVRPRPFPQAARAELRNTRLRQNIRHATTTIRRKTDQVTGELPDWQDLRTAGSAMKVEALRGLEANLLRLEEMVARAGGHVRWARDAAEACSIIVDLARQHGGGPIIKVKSITTEEIGLNPALHDAGMDPIETDLAEVIVQLGNDRSSHFLVPAIHKNRAEIRDLFREKFRNPDIGDAPEDLTRAARAHLRSHFLDANVAISGGNFAIAETGSICVLESEGNGRMCLTLAKTLITLIGIEKVLPRWQDLEVFLQLLPRASTGERMNPYTSVWTGVRPGDGPQNFHLVLLDNGRTRILADEVARETLHCIRCSRCLNVCPVYERTGGHAYSSEYPGPIGAILTPQLKGLDVAGSLPFASTLCGACLEACPVKINIPQISHLPSWAGGRSEAVAAAGLFGPRKSGDEGRALDVRKSAPSGDRPGTRASRQRAVCTKQRAFVASRTVGPLDRHAEFPGTRRPEFPCMVEAAGAEEVNAREEILGRIRQAVANAPERPVPRDYRRSWETIAAERVDRFSARLRDLGVTVLLAPDADLIPRIAEDRLAVRNIGSVLVPADLPAEWRPRIPFPIEDAGQSPHELDRIGGVITGCALAIAETGTIVLDGGARQGRRAISLVPDYCLCIVRADQVVGIVPEAIARLHDAVGEGRPITFISGPSATADIELSRVAGVHGPRTLEAVLLA